LIDFGHCSPIYGRPDALQRNCSWGCRYSRLDQAHLIFLVDEMLGPFPVEIANQVNGRREVEFQSYFMLQRLDAIIVNFPGETDGRMIFLDLLHGMPEIDSTECPRHDFFGRA
jgi:hypothetical protein